MSSWYFHALLIFLFIFHLNLTGNAQTQSVNSGKVISALFDTEAVSVSNSGERTETSEVSSIHAAATPSMEKRSLESHGVLKIPDPKFIAERASIRSQGAYFGVGFQQVRLDFREGGSIFSNDSALNGIAVNLGYFTEMFKLEYTRHAIILDLEESLQKQDLFFNNVEAIQNNFWYFRVLQLIPDLYFNFGIGVQTSEVRLTLKASSDLIDTDSSLSESSALYQEGSLLFGGGFSYFLTSNFFMQYRFTYGGFSPWITGSTVKNALQSNQNHTFFLQYYFSL